MKRPWIVIIILIVLPLSSTMAQPFKITRYNAESGLPSEVVKAVIQDSLGFIWIASDEGAARFDGVQFTAFRNQLSSNFVKSFKQLSNGKLIAITDMGIDEIRSFTDTVHFKNLIQGEVQPTDQRVAYPKLTFEDSQQRLWIGENTGISCYQDGQLRKYAFPSSETSTSFVYAFTFAEDAQQLLWAASYNGTLYLFDAPNELFIPYQLDVNIPNITGALFKGDKLLLTGYSGVFEISIDHELRRGTVKRLGKLKWITCFYKSNSGTIYLGTRNDGLYRLEEHGGNDSIIPVEQLKDGRVSSITDDQAGGLWIGTHKGIVHLHRPFFQTLEFEGKKAYIQDIVSNENDQTLFAVGRQIFKMTPQENGWKTESIWKYINSYAMKLAVQGEQLLIGLSSGNLQHLNLHTGKLINISITDNNPQYNTFITALHFGKNQQAWTAKNGLPGIYRIDCSNLNNPIIDYLNTQHGLNDDVILIKESTAGVLYVLTNSTRRPIYRYDSLENRFTPLPFTPLSCAKDLKIHDFDFINEQQIALATSCGLWKYDLQQYSLESIYIESINGLALAEAGYNAVVALADQNFLLGSKSGLIFTYNQQGLHYDELSGLPSNTISDRNLLLDQNKRLWVGTVEGAATATYQHMTPQETPTPIITQIKRNGKKQSFKNLTDYHKLPFDSYLEISFAALVYPSKNIRYQYRIIGVDSAWVSLAKQSSVFIPQLADGKYTFQVRAYHSNGYKWSKPAIVNFIIQKAWYFKWWMFFIYLVLFMALIYAFVRLNTWRLLRAKSKLEKVVQERMAESIAQNKLLNQQKEEIERQRDDIQRKNRWLEEAHQTIEQKNSELLAVNHELEEKVSTRTAELDQALIELQRYNAELDYFIYRAAHDLRGPIARIMGLANLIRMKNTDEEINLFVDRMDLTLNEMGNMLSRLMETLELKSNKVVLQPINVKDFLAQSIALFSPAELQAHVSAPSELLLHADFELLERLFENLIQNAIDFKRGTQEQAIVDFKVDVNQEERTVVIQMIDQGTGIVEEAQGHIFDMFYVGTEDAKGAGLGLYEAMVILERLKGKIKLLSSEWSETIFEITLPIYQNNRNSAS
ncbi:MAG: ligand-binding sensor domain-containing protein [Flammeovirgaceae bacterium]